MTPTIFFFYFFIDISGYSRCSIKTAGSITRGNKISAILYCNYSLCYENILVYNHCVQRVRYRNEISL